MSVFVLKKNMIDTSKSKTDNNKKAKTIVGDRVEEELLCPLKRNGKVVLSEGIHIVPYLYSEKVESWVRYLRISVFLRLVSNTKYLRIF